jgi:hypothetical protein
VEGLIKAKMNGLFSGVDHKIGLIILDFEFGKDYTTSLESLKSANFTTAIATTRILKPNEYYHLKILIRSRPDKILVRNKVPSGEFIQTEVVEYLKNDWVIFIDPDEVIDISLATCLFSVFRTCASDQTIGAITVPWQFYFKTHKLLGTIWGGCNQKYLLVNRKRFSFLPITHYGRVLKKGFREIPVILNSTETNLLHHYWMNSYTVFLKKHQRYLAL